MGMTYMKFRLGVFEVHANTSGSDVCTEDIRDITI